MSSTGQPGRSSLLEDGEYEGRGEVGLAEGGLAVGSSTSSLASDYWDFGDLPSFITKVSSTKKKEGRKSVKFASGAGASRGSKGGKMRILQRHVSDVSHDRFICMLQIHLRIGDDSVTVSWIIVARSLSSSINGQKYVAATAQAKDILSSHFLTIEIQNTSVNRRYHDCST